LQADIGFHECDYLIFGVATQVGPRLSLGSFAIPSCHAKDVGDMIQQRAKLRLLVSLTMSVAEEQARDPEVDQDSNQVNIDDMNCSQWAAWKAAEQLKVENMEREMVDLADGSDDKEEDDQKPKKKRSKYTDEKKSQSSSSSNSSSSSSQASKAERPKSTLGAGGSFMQDIAQAYKLKAEAAAMVATVQKKQEESAFEAKKRSERIQVLCSCTCGSSLELNSGATRSSCLDKNP
jgi:hypothetical protein